MMMEKLYHKPPINKIDLTDEKEKHYDRTL